MLVALALAAQLVTPDRDLFQIGSFAVLSAGRYDGTEPIGRLLLHGDFGVGTFDRLNGEMIVVDGRIYQTDAFGDVNQPPAVTTTPFACVVHFRPSLTVTLDRTYSASELQKLIDAKVGKDRWLAIRVDGKLGDTQTRAYPPQIKPYLPYAKLKPASVFPMSGIDGTLVGFRLPKSVGTANVPGYHFHFLSNDRKKGGHVLSYTVLSGKLQIMFLNPQIVKV